MRVLRFDAFTLDQSRRAVLRGEEVLELRSQSFDVLSHLAENAGRLVSKQELFKAVWGGAARTDDSLVQCIKDIRHALGDTGHRIVRTVHGRGYMLAASVTEAPSPDAAPPGDADVVESRSASTTTLQNGWQRVAMAAGLLFVVLGGSGWLLWNHVRPEAPVALVMMTAPSIAVLPFKAGGDGAGALAGEVETELSRTPRGYDMRIRSAAGYKGQVEHPKAAGRELGVRYLVLGSIRREGDVRHVNIQLVEAESGRPVWAEPFSYVPAESGAQNRMAARIARMLHGQVLKLESRLPLPAQPEAGHLVIMGRAIIAGERGGPDAIRKAQTLFEQALALDPDSVPALLGYGRTRVNWVLNAWVPKEQRKALLDEADVAVARAIKLDSRDVGAHVLRGALLRGQGKDAEAIAAFQRALDLLPTYPLAHAELGRAKIEIGRADESVGHIEEALRLSPTDSYHSAWYYWAGMAEAHLGNYRGAIDWLLKARQANQTYPNTVPWLAVAYGGRGEAGDLDQARAYLTEHLTNFPKFSIAGWNVALASRHPGVAAQRARIQAILCGLGAPGCDVTASTTR